MTMSSNYNHQLSSATIGIITALPKEFTAVCEVLSTNTTIDAPGSGAGRKYSLATISSKSGGQHTVAISLTTDMGNNSSAIRAALMKTHCPNVKHIIMTGIAGAVPNPSSAHDHVRLGDIVVSNNKGIIQYDLDKESLNGSTEIRCAPKPPSAELLQSVNFLHSDELRGHKPWDIFIEKASKQLGADWQRPSQTEDILRNWDDGSPSQVDHPDDKLRTTGSPRIFQGPIASANKLLKNPSKRDFLRDTYGVKAVEMEGSGVADATWTQDIGYLVIRGTCDYCNPDKGDIWQNYAAVAAAAYTRAVIEDLST